MSRFRFAIRYAAWHLLVSVGLALLVAILVFGVWFPWPYNEILGVGRLWLTLLAVDVVCGPMLTLVVASPKKSNRERHLDLFLIGFVQLSALAYGIYTLHQIKPIALVFEVDRLVVVSRSDVNPNELLASRFKPKNWWSAPMFLATRDAKDGDEVLRSIEKSMQGLEPSAQPDWWITKNEAAPAIKRQLKPLDILQKKYPKNIDIINMMKTSEKSHGGIFYLPFTSKKIKEWIVVFDENLNTLGYIPVDGF